MAPIFMLPVPRGEDLPVADEQRQPTVFHRLGARIPPSEAEIILHTRTHPNVGFEGGRHCRVLGYVVVDYEAVAEVEVDEEVSSVVALSVVLGADGSEA
jgi:hypothetical protein